MATKIDEVDVHVKEYTGWVIFDSIKNYQWKIGVHRMAVAVSGDCHKIGLAQLGFRVTTDDSTEPMLAMFTSQERLMTEVQMLPSVLVDDLMVNSDSVNEAPQKRATQSRCDRESLTVRAPTFHVNDDSTFITINFTG